MTSRSLNHFVDLRRWWTLLAVGVAAMSFTCVAEASIIANGTSTNAWGQNGWSANGWSQNGYGQKGWSSNGWAANGWAANGTATGSVVIRGAILP